MTTRPVAAEGAVRRTELSPVGHTATPLDRGDVDVWRTRIAVSRRALERHWDRLDVRERVRATQMLSTQARERYIAARGTLREILGHYLGTRPVSLTFQQNAFGKPALGPAFARTNLRFNLSHARDVALYAVSLGREVGIDIEACDPRRATTAIAAQFFSRAEVAALRSLPASEQLRAFYSTWTRKEAFIKARGEGLSLPLQSFTVSPADEPPRLVSSDRPEDVERWSMASLAVGDPFEASVVAEGCGWTVHCWDWIERAIS